MQFTETLKPPCKKIGHHSVSIYTSEIPERLDKVYRSDTGTSVHSAINMNTLSEYIIQMNSLKMPSLRSLWGGMQSFGMGSFLQAFLNGTFFRDLSALR